MLEIAVNFIKFISVRRIVSITSVKSIKLGSFSIRSKLVVPVRDRSKQQ